MSLFVWRENTETSWSEETIDYQITGFNNNIKEAFIGDVGQDVTGITLFYRKIC